MEENMTQLAALMNDHEITDEDGRLTDEETTSIEEPALQEQTTEEETHEEAKPTSTNEDEEEADLGVDDSGAQYIPKKRFDKVYGELKRTERELQAERQNKTQNIASTQPITPLPSIDQLVRGTTNVTADLETEFLFEKYPTFDPSSEHYNSAMDKTAADIYRANPGITKLAAAREAQKRVKEMTQSESSVRQEARIAKVQNADSGITSRVTRGDNTPDVNKMSLADKEAWLKEHGAW